VNNNHRYSRREFLTDASLLGIGAASLPILSAFAETHTYHSPGTGLNLAVVKNGTPSTNTERAIQALGGMQRFVKPGDHVVLKVNCVSAFSPEYAVNTHPDVIATVIRLCLASGAKDVTAVANDQASDYSGSGIGDAIVRAGGKWEILTRPADFREIILPRGLLLRNTRILNRVLDADVFINLPIAKDHAGSVLTLSMKNFMGINYDRQIMHARGLHQCIADLATAVKPNLIIMDANYLLLTNGPGGPGTTRHQKTVIAGIDPVLVDTYSAILFGKEPRQIDHIQYAADMGIGSMDLDGAKIEEFSVQ
jgi:uncharacterized protein (DUF362 family)